MTTTNAITEPRAERPTRCPDCGKRPVRAPITKSCHPCAARQVRLNERGAHGGDDNFDEALGVRWRVEAPRNVLDHQTKE